jgi:hypothetical protein
LEENKEKEEFREWWVSCPAFTVWVKTAGGAGSKIIDGAPIIRKWIGQNFFRFVSYYNAEFVRLEIK